MISAAFIIRYHGPQIVTFVVRVSGGYHRVFCTQTDLVDFALFNVAFFHKYSGRALGGHFISPNPVTWNSQKSNKNSISIR